MPAFNFKIVSGGQTGIDRVALDAAIDTGLQHGGWCPKGKLAEDGIIPGKYELSETESKNYAVRTERNVEDSDGTLIIYLAPISGGTALTARLAAKHGKPCFKLDFGGIDQANLKTNVESISSWIKENQIRVLNIAGPRHSSTPELSAQVYPFLISLFAAF